MARLDPSACKHGHEYTAENTIYRRNGGRRCRACYREQRRRYRHSPKGMLQQQRERVRLVEYRRAKTREWMRAWSRANRDLARRRQRDNNHRRWLTDPQYRAKRAAQNKAGFALRRGSKTATLTAGEWNAICLRQQGRCYYCGTATRLTQDHVVPVSLGGQHTAENVVGACAGCNYTKRDQLWRLF